VQQPISLQTNAAAISIEFSRQLTRINTYFFTKLTFDGKISQYGKFTHMENKAFPGAPETPALSGCPLPPLHEAQAVGITFSHFALSNNKLIARKIH
jgi:hypothetical protein